jgi:hypothetical protein
MSTLALALVPLSALALSPSPSRPCALIRPLPVSPLPLNAAFNDDRYHRHQQLPSIFFAQLTTTTTKIYWTSFFIKEGDGGHCCLQRRLMAAAAMAFLLLPSTTTISVLLSAPSHRRLCQ